MEDDRPQQGFFRSRTGLALIAFLLIGGFFLWTEHRAHVAVALPYWPYLLVLLCPLMHLFHHGHGGHGGGDHSDHERKGKDR